jgi:antitoxin MazE
MVLTRRFIRDHIVITQRENLAMKARLVRIGNSRGVRLPKPLIEEAGLEDDVELLVRDGAIVIASAMRPRTGWAAAAKRLHHRDKNRLPDPPVSTRFDEEEWEW